MTWKKSVRHNFTDLVDTIAPFKGNPQIEHTDVSAKKCSVQGTASKGQTRYHELIVITKY